MPALPQLVSKSPKHSHADQSTAPSHATDQIHTVCNDKAADSTDALEISTTDTARQEFIKQQIEYHPDRVKPRHGYQAESTHFRNALQFGFEIEYPLNRAADVLNFYVPTPEAPIDIEDWEKMTDQQRLDWIHDLVPWPIDHCFKLPLQKSYHVTQCGMTFLPDGLEVDTTGNIEIVSEPVSSLEEMLWQYARVEKHCGVGFAQGTISIPNSTAFGPEAQFAEGLQGQLNFYHMLDCFERLAIGYTKYKRDKRPAMKPFNHPWLGPMTREKQSFMNTFLEANAQGEKLDSKSTKIVRWAFSSFKYVGGTAYRPDIGGPQRIAFEIRDAHKNGEILKDRLLRTVLRMEEGSEQFSPFAHITAFDSVQDFNKFEFDIQNFLKEIFPSKEKAAFEHMYSDYDRRALQVYRNFALPLKDYDDVIRALGHSGLKNTIAKARGNYLNALQEVAKRYLKHEITKEQAQIEVQGAITYFSIESGLQKALTKWERGHLLHDPISARYASLSIQNLIPLEEDFPLTAWFGDIDQRKQRLQEQWPERISINASGDVSIHTGGLDSEELKKLEENVTLALSRGALWLAESKSPSIPSPQWAFGQSTSVPQQSRTNHDWLCLPITSEQEVRLRRAFRQKQVSRSKISTEFPSDTLGHLQIGHQQSLADYLDADPSDLWTAAQKRADGFQIRWVHTETAEAKPRLDMQKLKNDINHLAMRWPNHIQVIPKIRCYHEDKSKFREFVVISSSGLDDNQKAQLLDDYLHTLGEHVVSFPLREGADHLRTQFRTDTYTFTQEGFKQSAYRLSKRNPRIEPLVLLSPQQSESLKSYIHNILQNPNGMLGEMTPEAGTHCTKGNLDDNRPVSGQHNCTTWLTLAPIGQDAEPLRNLTDMNPSDYFHDNPGYWASFLLAESKSDAVGPVIYWTPQPLQDIEMESGSAFRWHWNAR